jgi:hypothetical protein
MLKLSPNSVELSLQMQNKIKNQPRISLLFQYYCEILGHGKVEFSSENLLERHGVHKHPGWPIYIQNQT